MSGPAAKAYAVYAAAQASRSSTITSTATRKRDRTEVWAAVIAALALCAIVIAILVTGDDQPPVSPTPAVSAPAGTGGVTMGRDAQVQLRQFRNTLGK